MKHAVFAMSLVSLLIGSHAFAQTAPAPAATPTPAIVPAVATVPPDSAAPTAPPPGSPVQPAGAVTATAMPGLDNSLSVFGVFGYYYGGSGVGLAGRYQKTINSGNLLMIPNVREDIGFEGGVDYYHYGFEGYSLNEFMFLAGVVWNFWFSDRFALYPKLEMGFGFGSFSGLNGIDPVGYGGFAIQAAAGMAYKVTALTLRAEAGSGSLRLGAAFVF